MGRVQVGLLTLTIPLLLLWVDAADGCACSTELREELNNLRESLQQLENRLYTSCEECPENYTRVGERCYRVFTESLAWHDATDNCTLEGAELVSLETPEEETLLREYLGTLSPDARFFTSLNELEEGGVWRWGLGATSQLLGEYNNWEQGEPNNYGDEDEQCMEFSLATGWNDVPCSAEFQWICERAPGRAAPGDRAWVEAAPGWGRWADRRWGYRGTGRGLGGYKPFWSPIRRDRQHPWATYNVGRQGDEEMTSENGGDGENEAVNERDEAGEEQDNDNENIENNENTENDENNENGQNDENDENNESRRNDSESFMVAMEGSN